MYINYYGLMSLSTVIIFVYCAFLEALFVMGCMNLLTMMDQKEWSAPIIYFAQLFMYGYGGYILFGKLRKYQNRDKATDSMTPQETAEDDGGKVKEKKEKKRKSKSKKDEE